MTTYRLYYCDRDNRVTHFVTLEAEGDQDAIARVRAEPHPCNREVWAGACRLAAIPGEAQAQSQALAA